MDDNSTIKRQQGLIQALEDCVMIMSNKHYNVSGILSPLTRYTINIDGPCGKKELNVLIKRLQMEAKVIGNGKITDLADLGEAIQRYAQIPDDGE